MKTKNKNGRTNERKTPGTKKTTNIFEKGYDLSTLKRSEILTASFGALKSNSIEFLCCHPSGVSLNERNIFSELQPKNNSNKNNLYESFFINIFSNY